MFLSITLVDLIRFKPFMLCMSLHPFKPIVFIKLLGLFDLIMLIKNLLELIVIMIITQFLLFGGTKAEDEFYPGFKLFENTHLLIGKLGRKQVEKLHGE